MASNVLVVEDNPDWRTKIVGYLREGKYEIHQAEDYERASKLLQMKEPLDVAIVDIRLVDDDETNKQGMDLLKELDEIADRTGTQAIVITGYGTVEWAREAFRDHQVVDFIEKQHFDPEEFKETVAEAVNRAHRRRFEIGQGRPD